MSTYTDCQLIYDTTPGQEGWFLRYSDDQECLDEGLSVTDPQDSEAALAEALRWMGEHAPDREDVAITVVPVHDVSLCSIDVGFDLRSHPEMTTELPRAAWYRVDTDAGEVVGSAADVVGRLGELGYACRIASE